MSLYEAVAFLGKNRVWLWNENKLLRFAAPKGVINAEAKKLLTTYRNYLVTAVNKQTPARCLVAPCSNNQNSLWFVQQLVPESPAYNVAVSFQMKDKFNSDVFSGCCSYCISLNPVLRTTFHHIQVSETNENILCQVVRDTIPVPVTFRNIALNDDSDYKNTLLSEYTKPFDLEYGPLFRCVVWKIANVSSLVLMIFHHTEIDAWSIKLLLQQFFRRYRDMIGEPVKEPGIIKQDFFEYLDYTLQQNLTVQTNRYARQLSFFSGWDQLKDEVVELKTDFPRPEIMQMRGSTIDFQISGTLTEKIHYFIKEQKISTGNFFCALFALVVYSCSGKKAFNIGVPVVNRGQKEYASTVGYFVNTIPVPITISSSEKISEIIKRIHSVASTAFTFQDVPLAVIVDHLNPSRDPSRPPLFQVLFNFLSRSLLGSVLDLFYSTGNKGPVVIEEIEVYPLPVPQQEGQFDLTCEVLERDGYFTGQIKYATSLFSEDTARALKVLLLRILDAVLQSPELPVSSLLSADLPKQPVIADSNQSIYDISVLDKTEYDKMIVGWNDTYVEYPQNQCLHQLFEAQVERTPSAIAVRFEGKDLTYKELNHRANQLAHHLRRQGVGPEVLIGVYMERSLEMVISLYGILKAGGAYVPLDPEYPSERVAFMMQDTQIPVLLTQDRLAAKLQEHEAKVICLDSDWASIAEESTDNPISGAAVENLAYVIYTSGSTGKPKGVMNCHRGICNRLLWMQDTYQLTEADHVLQKTPFSFDVSVWEFFWPLLVGAQLVIARPGGQKDSAYLVRLIIEHKITTLHFVPSMLQIFLEDKDVRKCISLKRVICSGEAMPYELQKRFFAKLDSELHNLYGPTEAAVDVTYWECQRQCDLRTVPIGRPVANTQLYILDRRMRPVPIGISGELHIGGVQVARGYLNRPELTAEKFIPDPFSSEPKARLYKTGDLVRFLPDGNIEFLGRLDFQVKIRGLRIELGEIESVFSQHSAVREVVVLAREDVPGDIRLTAYFVSMDQSRLNISELRSAKRR